MKYEELTERIIGCFYRVYNTLGSGFLEKVYENALAIEFEKGGLKFGKQVGIQVLYDEKVVGDYVADFIVENKIVVEIKAKVGIFSIDEAQLINYLKATDKDVGLILNFGKEAEIKRKIFESARGLS
ncbi:MAG: GxxExxY protein [archaeon]